MANRIAQCTNGALIDVSAIASISAIGERTGTYTVMFHNNNVYKTMFHTSFVITEENERHYDYVKGSIYGEFDREKLVAMWLAYLNEVPVTDGE